MLFAAREQILQDNPDLYSGAAVQKLIKPIKHLTAPLPLIDRQDNITE